MVYDLIGNALWYPTKPRLDKEGCVSLGHFSVDRSCLFLAQYFDSQLTKVLL